MCAHIGMFGDKKISRGSVCIVQTPFSRNLAGSKLGALDAKTFEVEVFAILCAHIDDDFLRGSCDRIGTTNLVCDMGVLNKVLRAVCGRIGTTWCMRRA